MKKTLAKIASALLLAVTIVLSPATALPRQLADVQVVSVSQYDLVTREMIAEAFYLMQKHYSHHVPSLVADFPIAIILTDVGGYLGCYGMLCVDESEAAYRYYTDPALAHYNFIFVNVGENKEYADAYYPNAPAVLRQMLVFVLAHEMGHHALTLSGVPLEDQHKLMACGSPDGEIVKVLGLGEVWPMEQRCRSMGG